MIYLNGAYASQRHWRRVVADLGPGFRRSTFDGPYPVGWTDEAGHDEIRKVFRRMKPMIPVARRLGLAGRSPPSCTPTSPSSPTCSTPRSVST